MTVTAAHILEAFPSLLQHVGGNLQAQAIRPCSQTHPVKGGIVFTSDAEFLSPLAKSEVAILIVSTPLLEEARHLISDKLTVLASRNPLLCMAFVNHRFFSLPFLRTPFEGEMIHKTAVVAKTARLAKNVVIQPHVVIGENVTIGENTFVGSNSVIESNTVIGCDNFIHSSVYIGHTCKLGDRVEIKPHSVIGSDGFGYARDEKNNNYRIPHYGAVIIEDDVHIGANVNIDRGTFEPAIFGAGTKIDNHCHFGHNTKVGKNCIITAGIIVAGSTTIGNNCVFGGRVSVNGHIKICDNCRIAPMSGVSNDITEPGDYGGYPVIKFKDSLKAQASIAKLPQIRKNIAKMARHMGLNLSD